MGMAIFYSDSVFFFVVEHVDSAGPCHQSWKSGSIWKCIRTKKKIEIGYFFLCLRRMTKDSDVDVVHLIAFHERATFFYRWFVSCVEFVPRLLDGVNYDHLLLGFYCWLCVVVARWPQRIEASFSFQMATGSFFCCCSETNDAFLR